MGACKTLVEQFAELKDRYIILFTKSANVDFLLPLNHKGHTIMLWTLSTHTASRQIEPRAGTMEERIEAARKCQEAGYPVRFKFKPFVPIKNWRAETTETLEMLFDNVRPDNVCIGPLHAIGGEGKIGPRLERVFGRDLIDEDFINTYQDPEDEWRIFPFELRKEICRFFISECKRLSPSTPASFCSETIQMWDELGHMTDMKPWNFVCNCSPHSTPGLKTVEHVEGPDEERIKQAIASKTIRV